jgi:hypothetical protein
MIRPPIAVLALLAFPLAGCVTRVDFDHRLADGGEISAHYFSTKSQKWAFGVDPATHLPTASINADTPSGWSGQDAGAFAQGILTGAGSAIGAGISAAAGKPPAPPIVVKPAVPGPAALFAPGPHRGVDGRTRVLRRAWPEEVWYTTSNGVRHTLKREDWRKVNGANEP